MKSKGTEILKYYDLAIIHKHLKAFCDYLDNDDRFDWHGDVSYLIDEYMDTLK